MERNSRQTAGKDKEARDVQILNYEFTTLKVARPLDPGRLLLTDLNGPANRLWSGLPNDN